MEVSQHDQLTLLQSSTPERIYRFAEKWYELLDARAAALAIGATAEEGRQLAQDRRAQLVFSALAGQTRAASEDLRRATLSWIAAAMSADPARLFDDAGMVRMRLADIPPHIRAVMTVEVKSDGSWKASMPPKLKVAEMLLTLTGDIAPHGGSAMPRVTFYGRGLK